MCDSRISSCHSSFSAVGWFLFIDGSCPSVEEAGPGWYSVRTRMLQPTPLRRRIFGLENEYGLIFSPNGRVYLPMEKVLGYIFEGLIPNSWPSNAFLVKDRKSTRLNSSHRCISYAVFCLKKKKNIENTTNIQQKN